MHSISQRWGQAGHCLGWTTWLTTTSTEGKVNIKPTLCQRFNCFDEEVVPLHRMKPRNRPNNHRIIPNAPRCSHRDSICWARAHVFAVDTIANNCMPLPMKPKSFVLRAADL